MYFYTMCAYTEDTCLFAFDVTHLVVFESYCFQTLIEVWKMNNMIK